MSVCFWIWWKYIKYNLWPSTLFISSCNQNKNCICYRLVMHTLVIYLAIFIKVYNIQSYLSKVRRCIDGNRNHLYRTQHNMSLAHPVYLSYENININLVKLSYISLSCHKVFITKAMIWPLHFTKILVVYNI